MRGQPQAAAGNEARAAGNDSGQWIGDMKAFAKHLSCGLAACGAYLALAGAAVAPTEMRVRIEPAEISLGEAATLTISASGSERPQIAPPMVAGLDFVVTGQSQRFQSINGVTTSSTSVSYQVTAQQPGIYTIPSFEPGGQPLVLRVDPGNAGTSSGAAGNGAAASGAAAAAAAASGPALPAGATHLTSGDAAFVRLRLAKHELYVGESVPVEIEIGTHDGMVASLNGLPSLNGDAFTLDNLAAKPERRSEEIVNGKPFTVFTWRSVLAAVKPGALSFTMEMPLTVRIRTEPPDAGFAGSPFGDVFNDPMFQNFFGGSTEKDVTITSAPSDFTVRALPSEDRPEDFSGAVGKFSISSELSDRQITAGDPATLKLTVKGEGNFGRVNSRMLSNVAHWKTYQPTAKFESADGSSYRGEKIFEQPVIAEQPGEQALPELTFSYFDPSARRYEVVHSAPLSAQVIPAPEGKALVGSLPTPPVPAAASPATPGAQGGLQPDHAASGGFVSSLVPLYYRPAYLALPALCALALPAWLLLRHRRKERSSGVGSTDTGGLVAELERAQAAGDGGNFFHAARALLQRVLAARWSISPEEVTLAEVDARLGAKSEVRNVFALADEALYAGRGFALADFEACKRTVLRQLQQESST